MVVARTMKVAGVFTLALLSCGGAVVSSGGDSAVGTGAVGGAGQDSSADFAGTGGVAGSGGVVDTGGIAGTGGVAGAGGAGTGGAPDACATDGDCPPVQCLIPPCPDSLCALGADGVRRCTVRAPVHVDACQPGGARSCCNSSTECMPLPHGMCVPLSFEYCGGPQPLPGNLCVYDACQGDADCAARPHGVCTAGYPRTCLYGPCRTGADCTKSAGGTCVLAKVGTPCPSVAVFCRYASDLCRADADCKGASPSGQVCVPAADGQGTVCINKLPPPV